jgi:AcrR family transcriptional regulator
MFGKQQKKATKRPIRQAKQQRSKATVDAIVQAAAQILSESGWSALNTNAVATRAGVSIGSLYEYFPDKQAILNVIVDEHLAAGEAKLAEGMRAMSGIKSMDEVVEAVVSGFVQLHQDDPRLHRVLSSEVPLSFEQKRRVEGLRSQIVRGVASALAESGCDGEIKATILVDTAETLTHRWFIDKAGLPASTEIMAGELSKMLKGYLFA